MAEQGKSTFQQLIDFASGLKTDFEWLRDRIGWLGAGVLIVLAAGAVAFIYVVTHWKDINEWLFFDRLINWFTRKPVPKARPDCLTIAVAQLAND